MVVSATQVSHDWSLADWSDSVCVWNLLQIKYMFVDVVTGLGVAFDFDIPHVGSYQSSQSTLG